MLPRWSMLLMFLAVAALLVFASSGVGGSWSTGWTGWIFLLFLLPCLLMLFMMGRSHRGTSEPGQGDDKADRERT